MSRENRAARRRSIVIPRPVLRFLTAAGWAVLIVAAMVLLLDAVRFLVAAGRNR